MSSRPLIQQRLWEDRLTCRVIDAHQQETLADFFEKRAHLLDYSAFERYHKEAVALSTIEDAIARYYPPAILARKLGAVLDRVLEWGDDKWSRLHVKAVEPSRTLQPMNIDGVIIEHPKILQMSYTKEIDLQGMVVWLVKILALEAGIISPQAVMGDFVKDNIGKVTEIFSDWGKKKSRQPILPEHVGLGPKDPFRKDVEKEIAAKTGISPRPNLDDAPDRPDLDKDRDVKRLQENERRMQHHLKKLQLELEENAAHQAELEEELAAAEETKKKLEGLETLEEQKEYAKYINVPSARDLRYITDTLRKLKMRREDIKFEIESTKKEMGEVPEKIRDRRKQVERDYQKDLVDWRKRKDAEGEKKLKEIEKSFFSEGGLGLDFQAGRMGKYRVGYKSGKIIFGFDVTFAIAMRPK